VLVLALALAPATAQDDAEPAMTIPLRNIPPDRVFELRTAAEDEVVGVATSKDLAAGLRVEAQLRGAKVLALYVRE
jgi:hypothetical protein